MQNDRKDNSREYQFDILKFILICIIVFHHYQQIAGNFFPEGINFAGGNFSWGLMVELFFIISGLFTLGSIRRIDKGESFGAFFLKKWLRFLPLLVICGLASILTKYIYSIYCTSEGVVVFPSSLWNLFASLTGIERWCDTNLMVNNPMWYVSVLLLCYVVLWACIKLSKNESRFLFLGMIISIGLLMKYCCTHLNISAPFFNYDIARGLICFFIGVVLALLFEKHKVQNNLLISICALMMVAFYITWFILSDQSIQGLGTEEQYNTLVFVVFPCIVLVFKNQLLKRLFDHKIFKHVGGIAYNIYAWHLSAIYAFILIASMIGFNYMGHKAMLLMLACCFIFAAISNQFIDKPLARSINNKVQEPK